MDTGCSSDRAQLGDGSIMEALQAFSLRQPCLDEFCIEVFQIRQDDELDEVGGITDISSCIGILVSPFFGGHAKESDIDEISFVGVGEARVSDGQLGVNEMLFDGIRVDLVVRLGDFATGGPV